NSWSIVSMTQEDAMSGNSINSQSRWSIKKSWLRAAVIAVPVVAGVLLGTHALIGQDGGGRPRNNRPPLVDENGDRLNLATIATPTTSFVSGDQTILAINDGANPRRSSEHYGNWPRGGTQWVQLTWSKPISTNKADVYWYTDGRGLHLP